MFNSKFFIRFSFLFAIFISQIASSLSAFDLLNDVSAEARVAYYHPSSKRVRRIYGDGWADYQLEFSKGLACHLRGYLGVSGFSRRGESIGFDHHNSTRLQLIPISVGLKYDFPLCECTKFYLGGAACYSFLKIRDHSEYVRRHIRKEEWGGVVQSGLSYLYNGWAEVSLFADYFFQRFNFSRSNELESSGYDSFYYDESRYVERNRLNLSGYKIGVGLGLTF